MKCILNFPHRNYQTKFLNQEWVLCLQNRKSGFACAHGVYFTELIDCILELDVHIYVYHPIIDIVPVVESGWFGFVHQ